MKDFKQYMTPGRRGHLIGIGGVSMSPLAEVLQGMGCTMFQGYYFDKPMPVNEFEEKYR